MSESLDNAAASEPRPSNTSNSPVKRGRLELSSKAEDLKRSIGAYAILNSVGAAYRKFSKKYTFSRGAIYNWFVHSSCHPASRFLCRKRILQTPNASNPDAFRPRKRGRKSLLSEEDLNTACETLDRAASSSIPIDINSASVRSVLTEQLHGTGRLKADGGPIDPSKPHFAQKVFR